MWLKNIRFQQRIIFSPAKNKIANRHIVKIMGGLGNQMFQYAFGQNFADVLYDISAYDTYEKRAFDLKLYNINRTFADKKQTHKYLKKTKLPKFIRKWLHLPKYKNITTEKQINYYDPNLLKTEDTYFEGYFQTEKYFCNIRDKILHEFTLLAPLDKPNEDLLNRIKSTNSIAVHIRRGDYLNPKVPLILLDKNYYKKAMDYLAEHVKNPHFYIFSNDYDWVRENIVSNYTQTIVDINDENHGYFDLELMRNCKHNIIANSSFSWWGAWLNQNPNKIVIAPKQWFKPTAKECYTDMIPDNWHKI